MKKALFILTALVSSNTFAQQCDINAAQLKADYKIINTHKAQQSTQLLTLWRDHQQVAHQGEMITELWQQLSNNQLRPIRFFNAEQRGIEYQPSEVRGVQNWSAKNQLVDSHLIEKMTLVNTQGEGCDQVKNYVLTEGDTQFKLTFLPQSKLVKTFRVTNEKGQTETVLSLNKVNSDAQVITAQFAKLDNFQTTDYADIGDNESDPFLAKMINLGFIEHGATGFYNQQGEAIQGGHHH
ncbi:hypothetical protein [Pseudoalteromonas sp.]|uniref:hypothetical protein n=1 Tax=Pseudoalteromonas sp. TaxID=53249 RepID=UPI001BD0F353|nr:hypothetical protein [Pseudoalteromonas sp.]